jgi:hypothetical protein
MDYLDTKLKILSEETQFYIKMTTAKGETEAK